MAKKARLKLESTRGVPQSQADVAAAIARMGELERKRQKRTAAMNDALNKVREKFEEAGREGAQEIKELGEGIKTYCEAHREELLEKGSKTKTFPAGSVAWRTRPASVSIKGVDAVIERLKAGGHDTFLRVTTTIDKDAMLKEKAAAGAIDGVTIKKDVEDFVITPFGVDLEEVVK